MIISPIPTPNPPSPPAIDLFTAMPFAHTFCDSLQSISYRPNPTKAAFSNAASSASSSSRSNTRIPYSADSARKRKAASCDVFQHLSRERGNHPAPPAIKVFQGDAHARSPDMSHLPAHIVITTTPKNEASTTLHTTSDSELLLGGNNISLRNSHAQMLDFLRAEREKCNRTPHSSMSEATQSSTTSYAMTIHDYSTAELPIPLGGKAKHIHANYSVHTNTSSFLVGPDSYKAPVTLIGKGGYGYAVKCTRVLGGPLRSPEGRRGSARRRGNDTPEKWSAAHAHAHASMVEKELPVILKVAHEHKHLTWEVVIHEQARPHATRQCAVQMPWDMPAASPAGILLSQAHDACCLLSLMQ